MSHCHTGIQVSFSGRVRNFALVPRLSEPTGRPEIFATAAKNRRCRWQGYRCSLDDASNRTRSSHRGEVNNLWSSRENRLPHQEPSREAREVATAEMAQAMVCVSRLAVGLPSG